jgi:hypothetical protein
MATQNLQRHYPGDPSWHSFRMDAVPELVPANRPANDMVDPLSDPDELRAYIRAFKPEYEITE